MKANKLFKKLALSGVALSAAAVTLTATTFAWYTSNTTVEVTNVSGATSSSADSSSFYIAAATSYTAPVAADPEVPGSGNPFYEVATIDTYGRDATPVYTATGTTATTGMVLSPVSYVNTAGTKRSYVPLTGASGSTKNTPVYGDYSATAVYEYILRFSNPNPTTDMPLYFSELTVTNNTTDYDAAAQTPLADNATINNATNPVGTGNHVGIINNNSTYNADLLKSLKLTIVATKMTNATTKSSTASDTKVTVIDLENWSDDDPTNGTHKDQNIVQNGANALGYLNKVLGYDLSNPSGYLASSEDEPVIRLDAKGENDTAYSPFTIPGGENASGYLEVRFTFWLDGWDEYCYDVMRQQSFQVGMKFTSASQNATIKSVAIA